MFFNMHTVQRLCGESIKESKFKDLCECGALASPALPGSPSPDLLPLCPALMLPESSRNLHTFCASSLVDSPARITLSSTWQTPA